MAKQKIDNGASAPVTVADSAISKMENKKKIKYEKRKAVKNA